MNCPLSPVRDQDSYILWLTVLKFLEVDELTVEEEGPHAMRVRKNLYFLLMFLLNCFDLFIRVGSILRFWVHFFCSNLMVQFWLLSITDWRSQEHIYIHIYHEEKQLSLWPPFSIIISMFKVYWHWGFRYLTARDR